MTAPVRMLDPQEEPREPQRIDRILGKLGPAWRRVPDWELVWLVVNLVRSGAWVPGGRGRGHAHRLLEADPG